MTATIDAHNDFQPLSQALVVAGSFSEYLNWRKENPSVRCCTYIEQLEDLEGVDEFLANIVLYGHYERNPVYHTHKMHKLLAERCSPFHAYLH